MKDRNSQGLTGFWGFDFSKQTPAPSTVACGAWRPSPGGAEPWNAVHAFWSRVWAKLSEPCH